MLILLLACVAAQDPQAVTFRMEREHTQVVVRGEGIATIIQGDEKTPRPYVCNVRLGFLAITRPHPPVKGQEEVDHETMHPGIWMAFGDLDGADSWRNKAKIASSDRVLDLAGPTRGFTTSLLYGRSLEEREPVCKGTWAIHVVPRPAGALFLWQATFSSEANEFAFGDQEEMGLGVRLSKALSVKSGGRILNSGGQKDEKEAWGKEADWCDYRGTAGGRRAGILLMSDPANFKRPWFHVRDYGLMVANPFGRNAFTKGERSRVAVRKGETFRLRFGVFVYSAAKDDEVDPSGEYREFLKTIERK